MSAHKYFSLLFYLTFVCGSLSFDYSITPISHSDCPSIDDINHAVMLPYPQDCNKYYSCLNGKAYLQQCPNNLHWSTVTYRCDYPAAAKCQTTTWSLTTETLNAPAIISSTGETLYQLHPLDCAKYYKCPVLSCPSNYYWNILTEKCDFPHNTHCPFITDTRQTTGSISSPPLSTETFGRETQLRDEFTLHYPNDCNKFYQCKMMTCPPNYHWNEATQQCDLIYLSQCRLQSQLPVVMETSSAAVPTAFTPPPTQAVAVTQSNKNTPLECLDCAQRCIGNVDQYLSHPFDCHKFIQCNGLSFIHTCPDELFWNAKQNTCDRVCVTN